MKGVERTLERALCKFEGDLLNRVGCRILMIGLGLAMLYRGSTEITLAPFFYGSEGIAVGNLQGIFFGEWIEPVLRTAPVYYLINVAWIVGGVLLVVNRLHRFAALLVFIGLLASILLCNIADGGDTAALAFSFCIIFFANPNVATTKRFHLVHIAHNMAVFAVYAQLIVIYLDSGYTKLSGETWRNGTALYYVMTSDTFGSGITWIENLFRDPIIVGLGTFLTIVYQTGFLFMLTSRFHLLWVMIGLGIHIGIGGLMGLLTFATVMCSAVLFTVTDREWRIVHIVFKRLFRRKQRPIAHTMKTVETQGV